MAFASSVVTRCSILALAPQLAGLAVGPRVAPVFTTPSSIPFRAHTGSSYRIAQRLVLTLAAVTAVWPPMFTVTTTVLILTPR